MRTFVIDASTAVSAALTRDGRSRKVLGAARAAGVIALSRPVLDEITAVLNRPRFAALIPPDERLAVLDQLTFGARWVVPLQPVADCRDAKDNIYLELALAAEADAIVSGDRDLTVLHPWRGIPILTSAEFLSFLGLPAS